jgi:hypothetical protein
MKPNLNHAIHQDARALLADAAERQREYDEYDEMKAAQASVYRKRPEPVIARHKWATFFVAALVLSALVMIAAHFLVTP